MSKKTLEWFDRALAARSSPEGIPYFRHELVAIVRGLENGGMVMGAVLSGDGLEILLRERLPRLREILASLPPPPEPRPKREKPKRAVSSKEAAWVTALPPLGDGMPFGAKASFAVGGLLAAGFAPATEMMLVVSSSGMGVFDAATMRRVGRDANADLGPEYPDVVDGISPIASARVELDGCEGGSALPVVTADGLAVQIADEEAHTLVWMHARADEGGLSHPAKLAGRFEEVRAVGFSDSGKAFVVAEQHTLHLWFRR